VVSMVRQMLMCNTVQYTVPCTVIKLGSKQVLLQSKKEIGIAGHFSEKLTISLESDMSIV